MMLPTIVKPLRRQAPAPVVSTSAGDQLAQSSDSIRRWLLIGGSIVVAFVGSTIAWGMRTVISGAIVASGVVVVDSNVKKIQHPTGGIIGQIYVKDGDHVEAGDVLVRLDDTITRANFQMITNQLDEIAIRQSRLRAEINDDPELNFSENISSKRNDRALTEILRTEKSLFTSRLNAHRGQQSQLKERIRQLDQEILGLDAQLIAKKRETALAEAELATISQLEEKRLISVARVTASRRLVAQLSGDIGKIASQTAQARAKIAETELQILSLDDERKAEAGKALREQQSKSSELTEKLATAEDQLKRIAIRSPQNGIVHKLTAYTVGGVISPGEQIMLIVPNTDQLVIEAKLPPQEIDHVKVGQISQIRFSAFSRHTTPEFKAVVTNISADIVNGDQPEQNPDNASRDDSYYVVRLALTDDTEKKPNDVVLLPGMPAEIHLETGDRTVLSYLMKPLLDQFARTFREI